MNDRVVPTLEVKPKLTCDTLGSGTAGGVQSSIEWQGPFSDLVAVLVCTLIHWCMRRTIWIRRNYTGNVYILCESICNRQKLRDVQSFLISNAAVTDEMTQLP